MTVSPASMVRSRLLKAQALLRQGRVQEAEVDLSWLVHKYPEAGEAWLLLASIYGPQGRYDEAADCCGRVLAINPQQPVAHSLLGSAMACLGRRDEAIAHLITARSLAPGDPDIQFNLAGALFSSGRVEEAQESFQAVLAIQPEHALANYGFGNCCVALGRWHDAVNAYRKAFQLMPDNYDINMSLGCAYAGIGNLDRAIESYQRAVKLTAEPSVALCELAGAMQLQGDLGRALEYIVQSVEHQPDNVYARAARASILYKLGRIEPAHGQVRELVREGNAFPHLVTVWGQLCHHFDECQEVIAMGESLLATGHQDKANRAKLHFTLGRLYDATGEYNLAFKHYTHGNTVMPASFDHDDIRAMIDSLIVAYSEEVMADLPRSRSQDRRPVFILGMPRSGTSLVEQILSSHPGVFGGGERSDIKEFAKDMFRGRESELSACIQAVGQSEFDSLANRYLHAMSMQSGDALRVTDKMPENFLWLGLIWQLFPQARVIHCRRDPRDTCLSIYFQQFSKSHGYASDLGNIAFYYRQYERLMKHWCKVLDIPVLEVDYARLVVDTEEQVRKLIQFLGLEWDDRCLEFHASDRVIATASWDQVRQPVYVRSLGRWRHYREHLGVLLAEFGDDDAPMTNAAS